MTVSSEWSDETAAAIEQLTRSFKDAATAKLDCTPETIEQGLAKLVLTLVEFLRCVLERQAIRRMEGGSLTDEQIEAMGRALMVLEAKIHELAKGFGVRPEDLNLDLGPFGRLLK